MSWSSNGKIAAGFTPDEWDQAVAAIPVHGGQETPEETAQQVQAARECAKQLLYSGGFGQRASRHGYRLALSGHANAEHEPRERYTPDLIVVSVQQAPDGE